MRNRPVRSRGLRRRGRYELPDRAGIIFFDGRMKKQFDREIPRMMEVLARRARELNFRVTHISARNKVGVLTLLLAERKIRALVVRPAEVLIASGYVRSLL